VCITNSCGIYRRGPQTPGTIPGTAVFVLSEFATKWPDLEDVLGRATRDHVAIGEGHGRDILGHPFNSVAWLATQLNSRGETLKAGQVVMTGSVMKTVFPVEDANYRFELGEIGFVEVEIR
jgi:2-keto-4-pentenoate hydratase